MEFCTAVWLHDDSAGAYVNNTVEAELSGGTAFNILDASDYIYFGFSRRFEMLVFFMSTLASYGALTWQYTSGADAGTWTRVIPHTDSGFASTRSYVGIKPPSGWTSVALTSSAPHNGHAPPDSTARFWLRCAAASVTTVGSVSQILCVPYAYYTDPNRVAAALQMPDFSTSTTPTFAEMEDRIHEAEGKVDYRAKKSWKYRIRSDEYHDFNLSGIKLWRSDVQSITSVQIWDGANWDTKTEARTSDYFYIPAEGMLYFSRYFLLPARLAYVGPHWWGWGIGEFSKAIKITYIYGRDLETDDQGAMVQKLATMMVASELYRSMDYSVLTVSGSDKVSLDRKIEGWKLEIEDDLESLRSWEIV